MTNREWLNSLSDEEFAKFLMEGAGIPSFYELLEWLQENKK